MGQGTIPDDWTGEYCCYQVQWPDSEQWLAVLRGVLTLPAQGRFWDEHTGVIVEAQAVVQETFDTNLHLEVSLMSCNDGLNSALNAIASAIAQSGAVNASVGASGGCGCSSDVVVSVNGGYQGSVVAPVSGDTIPIYGTIPPLTVPFGEIPDGFSTAEEWTLERCQVANGLVDGAVATLRIWAAINFGQSAGLAGLILAAAVGLITLGPLMIPLLIGALLILVGVTGLLADAADGIEADRDSWICALMTGNSVPGIVGLLSDLMDVLIAGLSVTTVVGAAIKTALLVLFSADNLNKLMERIASYSYPDADCSACACPLFVPAPVSPPRAAVEVLEETLTSISLGGGGYSDRNRWDISVTVNGHAFNDWCGPNLSLVEWELLSGSVVDGPDVDDCRWQIYDNVGAVVWDSCDVPTLPLCGAYFATISAAANTWRATFEPCTD